LNLASDPTIQRKITRMAERVRWKQPALSSRRRTATAEHFLNLVYTS
jgi:hypothetical protein